jgi:hypothetical protein
MTGIYVAPSSVAAGPDYARRLHEEAGVDLFQLRAGFDPSRESPGIGKAVEVVRRLGARLWFLVGTWWGHETGEVQGDDVMRPAILPDCDAPAHEAQWPVRSPGGPADDRIEAAIARLCAAYEPDGICLTHGRFHHPADLPGLFLWADGAFAEHMSRFGITREGLQDGWDGALRRLAAMESAAIVQMASGGLAAFLDAAGECSIFDLWFDARCRLLEESMERFRAAASSGGRPEMFFGENAFGPNSARLCGQDYQRLAGSCAFLQPLLGYVLWHGLQPIVAWATWLQRQSRLEEAVAIRVAASLMGLPGLSLPDRLADLGRDDEGPVALIRDIVGGQLDQAFVPGSPPLYPVFRGRGWPEGLALAMARRARDLGAEGVFFQGTEVLLVGAPDEGWG